MLHYLPGCDVRLNHPQAIEKITNYMRSKGIAIERCCRVKEQFLAEGDTIVNNCTLCDLILNETHPTNDCISLYEFILNDPDFPWVDHKGQSITVQDCWRTRENRPLQDAVRACLRKMNYQMIEMPVNFEKTTYCGIWLNNEPVPICVEVAPKTFREITENYTNLLPEDQQQQRMQAWVAQYSTDQILVYCNGCEKGIKLGGKQPVHLVELLAEGLS